MDVDCVSAFLTEAGGNNRFKSIGKNEYRTRNEISDEANAVGLLTA